MNHLPVANDGLDGPQWDSSLEFRPCSVDGDDEWLGYEAVHPLTWIPGNSAAAAATPTA